MANGALFIGWGQVARGREVVSLKVFGELVQFCTGLQQRGEIESFEPVALEPHGGDLWGFALLRGDVDKLSRVRNSDELLRMVNRGAMVVDNVGVIGARIGENLQKFMATYESSVADLT
jgi:hypothetical protein